MPTEYRVYYDLTSREYMLCGNQRQAQVDEIPVLVTKSFYVAVKAKDQLNGSIGEE